MDERKKVILTGTLFLALLAIGIALYYFFVLNKLHEPTPAEKPITKQPSRLPPEEGAGKGESVVPGLPPVGLDRSDDLVRKMAQDLTPHSKFATWLKNQGLIRRFVAAIDNIANGLSPRPQLEFLAPEKEFSIVRKKGRFYLNPANYSRYDQAVDVFSSLNTERSIRLYREFKPLIQEAYRELGYPNQDFDQTLIRAIVELLKTPVVSGDVAVEKKVVTYAMVDPRLEGLSPPQKHLFRMGPENVEIVQSKLRELATALGISENQLPKPQVY